MTVSCQELIARIYSQMDAMERDVKIMKRLLGVLVAAQIGMFGGLLTVMIQINNLR